MAHVQTRGTTGSGTSINLAYLSDNAAGNLLIGGVVNGDGGDDLDTVSDDSSNTWAERVTQVNTNDGLMHGAIWSAPNCAAGANTVTASFSVSQFSISLIIGEYSESGAVNDTSSSMGFGTALNSGSATTTEANELMIGLNGISQAGNAFTPDAAYTERIDNAGNRAAQYQDRYEATPQTDNSTATYTGSSGNWVALLATFLPAAAGGGAVGAANITKRIQRAVRIRPAAFSPGRAR